MTRITVRFPDNVYTRLKESKKEHLSINSMIIELLEKSLSDIEDIKQGKTQIDVEGLKQNG